ncbi:Aerotaxis receptor [BD1-7 clade bacterium]|uniref:Aerotaxis receptor n=1 Tax=BD1-7 clade bacterium TaxID=2029982 RepID=A0A5S9MX69_9GAMM|nr:Aerotaxis receptor [BD1-7 clade bacterium]
MQNMTPEQALDDAQPCQLSYHDGSTRTVYISDTETPFPFGKLIVSRTDTSGVITHMNQAFIDMSGFTEDELIGQPHAILRHPDMPRAVFKEIWETAGRGEKWSGYVKNLRKDGGYYWVNATVIPNYRNGELVGFSSVRRKPSPSKIAEIVAVYEAMKEEEVCQS